MSLVQHDHYSIRFNYKRIITSSLGIAALLTITPSASEDDSSHSNHSDLMKQIQAEAKQKMPILKTINSYKPPQQANFTAKLVADLLTTVMDSADTQGNILSNQLEKNIHSFIGQGASKNLSKALNHYGKAEVDISFDKTYGLGGRIDWLMPINESHKHLLFSQIGIGREQKKTLFNFGMGQRHIQERWMLGYHAFLDTDLNNGYLRTGLGAEAWRDYLKLATNLYLPLSKWKRFEQTYWDVRPARGYDLSLVSYLPFYPTVGARVKYEHYFGSDIGIFSYPELYSHPNIITLGLRYTPIPLITLSVDKRMHTWSQNETRASLKFSFQLDQSIRQQLRFKHHSLIGNRYDLVERNNTIVLEYKDPVFVSLPDSIAGDPQTNIPFTLKITSKYPISKITWSGNAASACGFATGCITTGANDQYNLALPTYHQDSSNQYQLQVQVINKIGNSSSSNIMLVTVNPNSTVLGSVPPLLIAQPISEKILTLNTSIQPFVPIIVSGGIAPYTLSVSPSLPAGLDIDPISGTINGQPTTITPTTIYRVAITDAARQTTHSHFTLTISPTPLATIVRVRKADFSIDPDNDYNQTVWPFKISGGVSPYTFTSNPPLPVGLLFDHQGNISGGPQVSIPETTYTITAMDSLGASVSKNFTLTIHE